MTVNWAFGFEGIAVGVAEVEVVVPEVLSVISEGTAELVVEDVAEASWPRGFAPMAVEEGEDEDVGVDSVPTGYASSRALPLRWDSPSNVTRAFSLAQVRFAVLKRARITLSKSGMEKLDWASEMRRGIASPIVTLG